MPCNCGKTRQVQPVRKPAQAPTPPVQPRGEVQRLGQRPGTQASAARTETFTLVNGAGQRTTFGSRLEAEAALVRLGGRGRIVPT